MTCAAVAAAARAHRESCARSGRRRARHGAARRGTAQGSAGRETARDGAGRGAAQRAVRRNLEANVLTLAVAVQPQHQVVRPLGLVLQVCAHRAASGHLGRLRAEEELRVDIPRLPGHAKRTQHAVRCVCARTRARVCVCQEDSACRARQSRPLGQERRVGARGLVDAPTTQE